MAEQYSGLGQKLRELRTSQGKTLKEVSALSSTPVPSLSRYERGATNPPVDVIFKLADIYNVSVDFLVGSYPPSLSDADMQRISDDDYYRNRIELSDEYVQHNLDWHGKNLTKIECDLISAVLSAVEKNK